MLGPIVALVAEKRAVGYIYTSEERVLARFAAFCAREFPGLAAPTQECVEAWLETSRRNSVSTRNQRLAAISSFYRWLQAQDPTRLACCQDILAIPAKKQPDSGVNHLTVAQTRGLLAAPDRATRQGRRDATLLATLYDTGARAQELADLAVRDIRLDAPALAAHSLVTGDSSDSPISESGSARAACPSRPFAR